ncbi:MAG: DUF3179 domain-containing protein, partial [Actinomycetota bacterium]|nr:DUF3179 domain-containing protein [Actinomycetota bacterium]
MRSNHTGRESDRYEFRPGATRRTFLKLLAGLGLAGGATYLGSRVLGGPGAAASKTTAPPAGLDTSPAAPSTIAPAAALPVFELADFADNVQSGGPPKDGIPPIDQPRYLGAEDVDFLEDGDVVFGLAREGRVVAYPQLILVWHEIVNDTFPDGPLSVTYCPLTGSTVAFRGTAPSGEPLTFGTSGNLVNSNLLMYDRQTDSRWPQILARAISGPALGAALQEVPVAWTTWGRWRQAHPDTEVLSTDTGYVRSYGSDPYGSYNPLGGYFASGSPRLFPVMHFDERFDDKEVFVGVKHGPARLAVRKETLRAEGAVRADMGEDPVVLLHDPNLDEGFA